MNKVNKKPGHRTGALFGFCLFVGCAGAMPPVQQLTRDDIGYATRHDCAIVEAEVSAGKPFAVGTRSEGTGYGLRVISVLRPAKQDIPQSFTYDYSKTPRLRPGRYVMILQPGPYNRAEPVSSSGARIAEIRKWIQAQ